MTLCEPCKKEGREQAAHYLTKPPQCHWHYTGKPHPQTVARNETFAPKSETFAPKSETLAELAADAKEEGSMASHPGRARRAVIDDEQFRKDWADGLSEKELRKKHHAGSAAIAATRDRLGLPARPTGRSCKPANRKPQLWRASPMPATKRDGSLAPGALTSCPSLAAVIADLESRRDKLNIAIHALRGITNVET